MEVQMLLMLVHLGEVCFDCVQLVAEYFPFQKHLLAA